jgi:glycosyltransferase involved in cell wall biosynthesis
MKITTILPVSRVKYLDRVLASLLKQTVKTKNLIIVFDGPDSEFVQVRNKIMELDIENKVCVPTPYNRQAFSIPERRWHIVGIHNQIRGLLGDCDWVFSVEDDGILPENALADLIAVVKAHNDVGMVTGVELGRWGLPYVGAWRVDDISDPKIITSLENKTSEPTTEEIDACGLYCALIRADLYKEHEFDARNGLGPDVNLGLYLRQKSYKNYINWGIPVTHLTEKINVEIEIPATSKSRVVTLRLSSGGVWKQ